MTQDTTNRSTYLTKATADSLTLLQQLQLELDTALNKFRLIILVGLPLFAVFSVYLVIVGRLFAEGENQIWAFAIAAGVNTQLLGLSVAQIIHVIAIGRRRRDEFEHLTLYRERRFRHAEQARTPPTESGNHDNNP